jgi:oxygen-independent coproporphyrinogen-3 oxidase
LARALGFGTGHLSLYQLTIEPGTRFATDVRRRAFTPMDSDPAAELFELTQEITRAAGLPAYEVSNHAVPGEESLHNLTYWRYQDYAGIGPGAHGRRGGKATQRHRKPENWLEAVQAAGSGLSEERILAPPEQAAEAVMMGLRLAEGIDTRALAVRFGLDETAIIDPAAEARMEAIGMVTREGPRLTVTPQGMLVLDALLGELVADALVAA